MFKNAIAYVTRKSLKSFIIFLVILVMASIGLMSISIKQSTNEMVSSTFGNINSSFLMEINRQVNFGTPRGGGNVKGEDIKKISETEVVDSFVKRINSVADLVDYELIETPQTEQNQRENFKNAVMITGVNNSEKETKFVSGAFSLIEGSHLNDQDKNKVLIHKDLAQKNNLKLGDKIKLKSNLYDADNVKQADETVEVEIKGIFDGHNKGGVVASQELYENNIISDIDTAAKVYGYTEDTAVYQDATFFVKGNINVDQVIKTLSKLDIDWRQYNLIKSTANYPALQLSISKIFAITNQLLIGSLVFAGIIITLLLTLWMNARKKEIAIMLSIGRTKGQIFCQHLLEMILISVPAMLGAYLLTNKIGTQISNLILERINNNILNEIAEKAASSQLGAGAETEGFTKTISDLSIHVDLQSLLLVGSFIMVVLLISLFISSYQTIRKNPRELLIDTK